MNEPRLGIGLHQLGSGFKINHTDGIVDVSQGVMSNTVAVANNVVNTSRMVFDGTRLGISGGNLVISMVSGSANFAILAEHEYPGGSFSVHNGGTGTPITVTTSDTVIGDAGFEAGERAVFTLRNFTTGALYQGTLWSHSNGGNWSGWVTKIGMSSSLPVAVDSTLAINNGLIGRVATPGEILQVVALNNADLPVTGSGTVMCQFTYSFTPKSANSKLIITADADIAVAGYGAGKWTSSVLYRGTSIAAKSNTWDSAAGVDARGAPLMPIQAVVDSNISTLAGQIIVRLALVTGGDTGSIGSRNLTVVEIAK